MVVWGDKELTPHRSFWRNERGRGWIRRSPISIAAAVIYMITQLSDEKKPLRDISLATGVAEGTIRNSYKDLYPYASRLIPSSFAKEDDLRNLCSP
ncbi:hypothetical protein IFM89_016103 [Coptis chinensis]|uniref:Transcription factor TFIIB cyclin-like domain-containing protein n=1 Tax=Coptis chinensis TaxID=261450 RepID=A0A835HXX2_9MAGN|nr:hypothetical protein IFM89_016103 [Coptis chinensis]